MKEKRQFNVRLKEPLREAADAICEQLDFKKDELVEVALRSVFGSKDGVIRAKRKMIEETARSMELSFDAPDGQPIGEQLELVA